VNLTPEQQAIGRRNFLKAVAGVPALAGLGAAAAFEGPVRGGPLRIGFIGVGGEGRVLLSQVDPAYGDVRALCDINPDQLKKADEVLAKTKRPAAKHYAEWKDMLQHEDIEAVIIAVPLWAHADVTEGCLDAGKHVLCEKMMAWDVAGCERMRAAAVRNKRVLEIGYQRNYNPIYQSAYTGIVKAGVLGDVYHARLAWHRNGPWRRKAEPPSPDYDPSKWGYPTFDHLYNWRLYKRYSRGLLAELGSHQMNITNWFFDAVPEAALGSGNIARYKDREVWDHVYATFEYPGGRTAVFSAIESNAFDNYYEAFFGTKGTLILQGEAEAYLFEEANGGGSGSGASTPKPTGIEVTGKAAGPALDASESRIADAAGRPRTAAAASGNGNGNGNGGSGDRVDRLAAYRHEISAFCAAVRTGSPLLCGPDRAIHSARACIAADRATDTKSRQRLADLDTAPAAATS
jgi:predicted dehydrogenase